MLIKNKIKYYKLILIQVLAISAILLSGCSKKTVDEDKFAKIYAEMIIAQDTANYAPNNFKPVQDTILKRYGVNRTEYTATVEAYNKDPQKWEKFFDKAISYVETLRKPKNPGQPVKPK
jgi:predicted ATP-binding protein involved in virulence